MKKLLGLLSLSAAMLLGGQTNAQVYVRAGGGAGIGVNKDAYAVPDLRRDSNNLVVEQHTTFGSFGSGARFGAAVGYMITPYFGVELSVYYFQGFKQDYGATTGGSTTQYKRTGYSYQLRTLPSLIIQAPEGKFRPFARFGVLIPVAGQAIIEESWAFNNQSIRSKRTDIEGKFSVGFESSIGVAYAINDNLSITLDVTHTALRIKSSKGTVTVDEVEDANGNVSNNLDGADKITTEIVFQDVLTRESNISKVLASFSQDFPEDVVIGIDGTFDLDRPLNLPTQSSNSNSLSLNIGIQYSFGKTN